MLVRRSGAFADYHKRCLFSEFPDANAAIRLISGIFILDDSNFPKSIYLI